MPDVEVPPEDLPPEAAQSSAPAPTPGAEVPSEDLPEDPTTAPVVPDSGKYDSGIEQVKAGLEGAAKGVAGPLATYAETNLLGVDPKDIEGRAEANPWTHGLSEAAGFIGPAIATLGASAEASAGAGAISTLAKYGTLPGLMGEASNAIAKTTELGKVGSTALKLAIEGGLFKASDNASKMILGETDPEAPVAAVMAGIPISMLLGGALGAVGGKASQKLQELASGKASGRLSQALVDFGNRFDFLSKNKDVVGAATEEAQHLHDTVAGAISDGFSLKRDAMDKLTQGLDPEKIGGYVSDLAGKLEGADSALLNDSGFQRELGKWRDAVTPKRDIIGSVVDQPSAADVFEATDNLKRNLQNMAKFEKRATDPNTQYLTRMAANLSHDVRTSLEDPDVWGDMGAFQKELNGAYGEMQNPLKDFTSAAMSTRDGAKEVDPGKIANIFRSVTKGKPGVGFKADKVADFFDPAKKFLDTVDKLHIQNGVESPIPKVSTNVLDEMLNGDVSKGQKMADWIFGAGPGAIGWAGGHAVGTTVGAALGHPYLGYRAGEHTAPLLKEMGMKPTRWAVATMLKAMSSGETNGIPQLMDYTNGIQNGANRIENSVGNLFRAGGKKYLESDFSDKEREAIRKHVIDGGLQKQLMDSQNASGQNSTTPTPGFAHGGEVLVPPPPPPSSDKPVKPALQGMNSVAAVFPQQAMLIGAAKSRIAGYLNQFRPDDIKTGKPFDAVMPNTKKEKSFNRALDIAHKPLSVIDHIKNGTLEPEHLQHLGGMYPELASHLQQKITEKAMDAQMKGEKPSYKVRQGMSLFMGAPMESNLTPQNIQAAQATFAIQKAQPQGGGAPMGKNKSEKLSDAAGQYRTSQQASVARQNRIKP